MNLEDFRTEMLAEVESREGLDGSDAAFASVSASRLEQANEITSFQPCYYRAPTGKIRIDGYSFDEADDTVRVFIVNRKSGSSMETLLQADVKAVFGRLTRFLELATSDGLGNALDDNRPARDFVKSLLDVRYELTRIEAYLITDDALTSKVVDWPEGSVANIPVRFHIWDISRFFRAHISSTGLDEIVVDFKTEASPGIPCLEASIPDTPYGALLCVIPASLLAKIYDEYGSRLLEGNVRSFLTAKGKVNKGIRKTLLEQPEMFFAYNNGISAVAKSVVVEHTVRGIFLASAVDLQIVNGGQTTASIANVARVDKAGGLLDAFVPMKVVVVSGEESNDMVTSISRFANSQNKVSDADLSSNHPFQRRMEQISRRLLAPAKGDSQQETRWYYERARGQYINELSTFTPAAALRFRVISPKKQVVTKTDLARSELSWNLRPHIVCQGAQNVTLDFAKVVDASWTAREDSFNESYFRAIIARLILFRSAEELVTSQPWYVVGYRSIIVSYTLAKLSADIKRHDRGLIDTSRIWKEQTVGPILSKQLLVTAERVSRALFALPSGQQNLTQLAKRASCWEDILQLPETLIADIDQCLVSKRYAQEDDKKARAQQQLDTGIDEQSAVLSLGFDYWLKALTWASARDDVNPSDLKAIRCASGIGALPDDKQSKRLLALKRIFEADGFVVPK